MVTIDFATVIDYWSLGASHSTAATNHYSLQVAFNPFFQIDLQPASS
jgi:hypothetical protein